MSIEPGERLGRYEIVAPLGAGAMGEVYRARDTRLDRIVAVKVISASLAQDDEARSRFEQEARTIAALNDPHICTIHDVGRLLVARTHYRRVRRTARAERIRCGSEADVGHGPR